MASFHRVAPPEICMHFSCSPYVPHLLDLITRIKLGKEYRCKVFTVYDSGSKILLVQDPFVESKTGVDSKDLSVCKCVM